MKVLLRTTIKNKEIADQIENTLKKAGHTVDVSILKIKNKDEYSSTDKEMILKYDLILVEASEPAAQLGFEAAFALEKNIPTILFYNDETGNNSLFPLMGMNPSSKLIIKGYKKEELEQEIKNALEEIEKYLDNRFTMNLTPQIADFLNWISKNTKITRSDYIRSLIENALKKNTNYKKFLKG